MSNVTAPASGTDLPWTLDGTLDTSNTPATYSLSGTYDWVLLVLNEVSGDGTDTGLNMQINNFTGTYYDTVHEDGSNKSANSWWYLADTGDATVHPVSGVILQEGTYSTDPIIFGDLNADNSGSIDRGTTFDGTNNGLTSPLTQFTLDWFSGNGNGGTVEVYGRDEQ